ncbi:hypothetical protein ACFE04_024260 [Oxalis oulophora]
MERPVAVALEFPVTNSRRAPKRLRERLDVDHHNHKTPTVEEIEAKLKEAQLRRQFEFYESEDSWPWPVCGTGFGNYDKQFYEMLSNKARTKPRSPSRSSSQEEDLGHRLEEKLRAAEQKRLNILAEAQMRLARLDELRRAAKNGAKLRFEKERQKLGTKVESRVQQARENRVRILKAYIQRRATLKERSSQSLSRRIARENKYKERVCAAIQQKRAAAEKKRQALIEAEKKRARARFLQARKVAKSVSHQREVERRKMKEELENRLQRARRQRAEYLRQRCRSPNSTPCYNSRLNKQADILSRELARCWRRFLEQKRTTLALTQAHDALNINEKSVKSMPFEQLALLIESPTTLQTVKNLLDRFELRLRVSKAVGMNSFQFGLENIDHLLKRVVTPRRRTVRTSLRSREVKKVSPNKEAARKNLTKSSRYPVRVVLCAYMIVGHPDAVFTGQGPREIALADSALEFVREFELLVKIILEGPIQTSDEVSDSNSQKRVTFRSQIAAFDRAWCSYLNCFVSWKVKDAQLLEGDLVRAACQLELSMIQKCKLTPEGEEDGTLTHDMKAIQKQVSEDQKLLREKVHHLSGDAGIGRMEGALSEARSKYFEAKEKGSPIGSPITQFLSSGSPSLAVGPSSSATNSTERPSRVARRLFNEDNKSSSIEESLVDDASSNRTQKVTENEMIVNEFLHQQNNTLVDSLSVSHENKDSIKEKIRQTMEKAFWDSIMESMKQEEPDFNPILQLVKEVRDEICEMAPQSWKQEIVEAIDLEILSQVLRSGNLDIDYLGKILEFSLATLQKLSSPANDDEMKATHMKLLTDLSELCQSEDESSRSPVFAMVKGLRFVLEQIQALKQEISKARIRMMEPLLKGPAGFDYLRNSFTKHHGSPSNALSSLPRTSDWLLSISNIVNQEWEEHKTSLSAFMDTESQGLVVPPATLRTGGSALINNSGSRLTSPTANISGPGTQQPGCKGEKVDLLVRLGLLKLVNRISGLTEDTLPETFELNTSRLRFIQSQIQKIIVISTSILIYRQFLVSERVVNTASEMEQIIFKCTEQLLTLVDLNENTGIEQLIEVMCQAADASKLQSGKPVMARMLAKSLQAGDPVFERVSIVVYKALRGVVLGGSGSQGRKLAEASLRQIGAVGLSDRVVEAAEVLVVAATVSETVHGPWYINLTRNM